MKKQFTLLFLSFCLLFAYSVNAQNCMIIQDSITTGDDATAYQLYSYDAQSRLVKVDEIDSASQSINSFDTLIYTVNDLVDKVETYSVPNLNLERSVRFTYDINNKLTRIFETGTNMNGTWAKAFDLVYHPNGLLSDMNFDQNSLVGSPEGFNASFKNISWINGNLMFVHVVGDLGNGWDTLELEVLSDGKNNLNHQLYISEAPDLLWHVNTNNVLELTFLYNETMGPVGTIALKNSFTYNLNNDVETWTEHPAVFDDKSRTTWYNWDCSITTGVINNVDETSVNVFPNPFMSSLQINFENMNSTFEVSAFIKDINGKTVAQKTETVSNSVLEWKQLDEIATGHYVLQLMVNDRIYTHKLLKN